MGFGILFIGYLLTFFMSLAPYGFIIRLIGSLIISSAILKLREYGKEFVYSLYSSFALLILCLINAVIDGSEKFGYSLPYLSSRYNTISQWVDLFIVSIFNITLLIGIYLFGKRLGAGMQSTASVRNSVFVCAYFLFSVLYYGPFKNNETFLRYMSLPLLCFQLFWIIADSVLIFSCYMNICPAGDEEMKRKKTNIAFIDNILEESDRRTEKATKETTEYFKNKEIERINRKNQKRGK